MCQVYKHKNTATQHSAFSGLHPARNLAECENEQGQKIKNILNKNFFLE